MKKLLLFSLLLAACGQPLTGSTGQPGVPGTGCTVSQLPVNNVTPNGGALIQCTDGTSSAVLNGTVVLPVQFCKGTTTYPTTFTEVGFIINGKIYAVYSLNNGFLTYTPPGYYSSNALNSSCNFTINNDNSITN